MKISTQHALACPQCRYPLERLSLQECVSCPNCDAHYLYREGVLDFIPSKDFYWGEISRDEMVHINQQAVREGWFAAIQQGFADDPDKIAYITDPARLGWLFHCFDGQANEVCLSTGSGWGSLVFSLSHFYKTIYSVDGVYERLRFQAIRAAEDGVDNMIILRSSLLRLPIEDNSVDLVVVNGVLEWIGLSDLERDPEALQREFLQEINRVLKPNGRVYIGTENRLSALYFLGTPDRSGLPFTGLVPRHLASAMLRARTMLRNIKDRSSIHGFSGRESNYRTYTYSAWGYETLLRESGFSQTSLYWAWPSYSYPRMSGPLDAESIRYMAARFKEQVNSPWLALAIEAVSRLPKRFLKLMSKLFAPHFLIIASRQFHATALQEEILEKNPTARSFVRLSVGVNAEVKSTFLLLNEDSRVSRAVRVVEDSSASESLNSFICQESDGFQGQSIRPHHQAHVRAAASWLAGFHRRSMQGYWPAWELAEEVNALAQTAEAIEKNEDVSRLLQMYAERYEQIIRSTSLPITAEHGDYTVPNILIGDAGDVNVIDWEFSREQGNPLMDIGAFCFSLLRNTSRAGSFPKQIKPGTLLYLFCQEYGQDWATLFSLSPTYYLLRLIDRIRSQNSGKAITHLMLSQWLPLLRATLEFSLTTQETRQRKTVPVM